MFNKQKSIKKAELKTNPSQITLKLQSYTKIICEDLFSEGIVINLFNDTTPIIHGLHPSWNGKKLVKKSNWSITGQPLTEGVYFWKFKDKKGIMKCSKNYPEVTYCNTQWNIMVVGWDQPESYQTLATFIQNLTDNYKKDTECFYFMRRFFEDQPLFKIDMPLYLYAGTNTTGYSGTGCTWTLGMNLLCFSLRSGLENCVKLLINRHADLDFKDHYGNNLSYYIQYSSNKNILYVFDTLVKERLQLKTGKETDRPLRLADRSSRRGTEERDKKVGGDEEDKNNKEKELEKGTQGKPIKEWSKEEVCWWISFILFNNQCSIDESDLEKKIHKNFINGSVLAKMKESEIREILEVPFGVAKILFDAIETQVEIDNYPPVSPKPGLSKSPSIKLEESISNEKFGRLYTSLDDIVINAPLAPLVLMKKNDVPIPFEHSIQLIYQDQFDDIFYGSHMVYAEIGYSNILEENLLLTFDEYLAIFFYTLELDPPMLNLYARLNSTLSSCDRTQTAPRFKFYLYYLFNALRKIPIWKGSQDVYRGVSRNLVKLYPEKYAKGKTIVWYSFTSTTTDMGRVESFIQSEDSTIFCINGCLSGRSIERFSGHPDEAEILIPPGSRFEILAIIPLRQITMIQMKQIKGVELLLKLENS